VAVVIVCRATAQTNATTPTAEGSTPRNTAETLAAAGAVADAAQRLGSQWQQEERAVQMT
jgi:hypothetical protein